MALYQFSTSLETTVSELSAKLNKWYEDGASLTDITIVDTNNITMLINDKYCNVQYSKSLSSKANYYWFLCDSYGYETLIILCDSPTVSENGYRSTLGSALYNAIYFLHNDRLVRNQYVDESLCSQFNIPNGQIVSNVDDRMIFTKCTFNDSINLDTGSSEVTDKLYVSTNLVSAGFLTEISGSGEKFVNIGGIFYMPLNNLVLGLSHYKNRTILKNASVELWSGCLDDNEKIYDRTEQKIFYKTTSNIKMYPEGNREMGYLDLPIGQGIRLTSEKPFYNKTIYLVAYDTSVDQIKEKIFSDRMCGYLKRIISCGVHFFSSSNYICPVAFSLNKIVELPPYKIAENRNEIHPEAYKEIAYALVNMTTNNWSSGGAYYEATHIAYNANGSFLDYRLEEPSEGEYWKISYPGTIGHDQGGRTSGVWRFTDIIPKKNIYVLKTASTSGGEYKGYINNIKINKASSWPYYETLELTDYSKEYFISLGGDNFKNFPFGTNISTDQRSTSELKIDYFAIVDEAQSDEEIEANIKYLADKFKVDLES